MATCPLHPGVTLTCPSCAAAHAGRTSSPRKTAANRRNAKRPRPSRRKPQRIGNALEDESERSTPDLLDPEGAGEVED